MFRKWVLVRAVPAYFPVWVKFLFGVEPDGFYPAIRADNLVGVGVEMEHGDLACQPLEHFEET